MLDRIREWYWEVVPYEWRPGTIWYKLKCFFWHRYTTVRPRTLKGHGWVDRNVLLPHVMFEVLSQFIEKECSLGRVDWDGQEQDQKARKEMQELYDWWHKEYNKPEEKKKFEEYYQFCSKHQKLIFTPVGNWGSKMVWSYDSPEAEAKCEELREAYLQEEKELQEALIRNCKRLIDVMDYMWT